MLRLAHKAAFSKGSMALLWLWGLLLFSACSHNDSSVVDRLNALSYAYHYRDLDSAAAYAQMAGDAADGHGHGLAEALNNKAFVCIMRMEYAKADGLLDSIYSCTDNQVELLVADVQKMRICQRRSENRQFYDHRQSAIDRLKRIGEESNALDPRSSERLLYAETEFGIVSSAYYYYVGNDSLSADALLGIFTDGGISSDTAQYLNYLYNVGAGGIVSGASVDEIRLRELESLVACYFLAKEHGYVFFMANALEAMAAMFADKGVLDELLQRSPQAVNMMWHEVAADSPVQLACALADKSISLFESYGDVYQVAAAYRTKASCLIARGDYEAALSCLGKALEDAKINQAPDLVASIREQLSIACSGLGDKQASDYNRNIYLDLQEQTRQDRYMEARAYKLGKAVSQLNAMIAVAIGAIVFLAVLLWWFDFLYRKNKRNDNTADLAKPLVEWQRRHAALQECTAREREDISERYEVCLARKRKYGLRILENRARLSLVNSVLPLIDRMANELRRLARFGEDERVRKGRYEYAEELAAKIIECNDVLTQWIQLRQGELSLHIESFRLMPLFQMVGGSKTAFSMSGVELQVKDTELVVKADRALTLFMINTLTDNARKFTSAGGRVTIEAADQGSLVEISVEDSGCGIPKEQLGHIFDYKMRDGHGFGLVSCWGIMEKYRKVSKAFRDCSLTVESEVGKGSRFSFRLPKGQLRSRLAMLALFAFGLAGFGGGHWSAMAQGKDLCSSLSLASAFADSAYFSNIAGTYGQTLVYADSCLKYLNAHYRQTVHTGLAFMSLTGDSCLLPAEISWFRDSVPTNYNIIMDVRNESAIAALALHEWDLYKYNNEAYTQLFKEVSTDRTLSGYCMKMQQSQKDKTVAVIMLVTVLLMILPAYYFVYYRHRLYYRFCVDRIKEMMDVLLDEGLSNVEKLDAIDGLALEVYPPKLQEIVVKVKQALASAISDDARDTADMELAGDELRRLEYETNNLYVANSVLDNCLSALKHETMYYPSRIKALLPGGDANLKMMADLLVYYRDIYATLSLQATRLATVRLHLEPVPLAEVADCRACGIYVLGDKILLDYMFGVLQRMKGYGGMSVGEIPEAEGYLSVKVLIKGMTEGDVGRMFFPALANVPFLLCRQVVRDVSEATGCWRSGMSARYAGDGAIVEIVLPRYVKLTEKEEDGKV